MNLVQKPGSVTGMRWVQTISAGLFATFMAWPPAAARITAGQEQTSVEYRNAPAGVAYTVGSGDLGRSYLVAKGDALFVSPISYYTGSRGWDLSPGYESGQFLSFTRPVWNLCASCHAGLSRPVLGTRNRYQVPAFRFLSVGCERCHGSGELHVRERRENAPLGGAG